MTDTYTATLIATLWQLIKRYGEENNIVILDGMKDKLPESVNVGWNVVGDDIIVTVIEKERE